MGIFSAGRIALIVIPLLMAGGGYLYVKKLQENLVEFRVANEQLSSAVDLKTQEIERLNQNVTELKEISQEVQEQRERLSQEVDKLRDKFAEHDLGYLAEKKPDTIERLINSAIARYIEKVLEEIMEEPTNE